MRSSPASTRGSDPREDPGRVSRGRDLDHHALRPAARARLPLGGVAIEADRLEAGGRASVALGSLPFIAGFTVVFVVLGAGAAAIGGVLPFDRQTELAGLVLVVLGLTFVGLCRGRSGSSPPAWSRARGDEGQLLLGERSPSVPRRASARCSPRFSRWPPRARSSRRSAARRVLRGLGLAFLLGAVAFTQAMGRSAGCATTTSTSGIAEVARRPRPAPFFHRDWWLRVFLNRLLEDVGLGDI